MNVYCDLYDLEMFEEFVLKIGIYWVFMLNDMVMMDFFSCEIEDGNVVDIYFK